MDGFDDFRNLVRRMRDAQKKYFATRDRNWLAVSKGLERQVDDILLYYSDVRIPDKN